MGMWIGRNRKARVTYGFDEIALVPGEVTINPNEVDTSFEIPCPRGREPLKLKIPIIASAMDGVTNVRFCIEMAKLGGLGVVNLEGVQTRYENPEEALAQIAKADKNSVTEIIQKLYTQPIKERRYRRRLVDSSKGRAFRGPGRGSGRRSFRRAIDRLDGEAHIERVQVA